MKVPPIIRTRALALVFVMAVLFAVTACGSSSSTSAGSGSAIFTPPAPGGTPHPGGELVFDRSIEPITLDPVNVSENGSSWINLQIYDQLVEFVPGHTDPQPDLATSWTVSKDGLTYTFNLRSGVRFSDGTPVTAEDVRYSLWRLTGPLNIGAGFISQNFKRVSVVGPAQVRIELTRPTAALIDYLATSGCSIVPEHVLQKIGEKRFATHPIGSGPFVLAAWNRGKDLTLRRNPDYWRKGLPYLDGVDFKLTPEADTRILAVQSGGADVADSVPFSQIGTLRNGTQGRLLIRPLYSVAAVMLNHANPALRDVKVRRALNLAVPRQQIVQSVFAGAAEPATGVLPKLRYWDKAVKGWPYDVAAAKKLLASSSRPHGFNATILIQAGDPDLKALAQIVQQSWKALNVNVQIRQMDNATQQSKLITGDYQMLLFPVEAFSSDIPMEDELATFIQDYRSGNRSAFTNYNSPEASSLVERADASTSDSERSKLFAQLQQLSVDDAQMVTIAYVPSRYLVSNRVHGFDAMPTGWWRLEQTWLAP